jgi:hypothetical protein
MDITIMIQDGNTITQVSGRTDDTPVKNEVYQLASLIHELDPIQDYEMEIIQCTA